MLSEIFCSTSCVSTRESKEAVVSERQGSECRAWLLLEEIRKRYKISDRAVYNLSHSGDYVLCSIDTDAREGVQLGCDIEKVQKARMELAKRFFAAVNMKIFSDVIQKRQERKSSADTGY